MRCLLHGKADMRLNRRLLALFSIIFFIPLNAFASIRVKLSSLNIQDRIHIGVYGNYIVNDKLSFQKGSEIVVVKYEDGLMLYHEGLAYSAGKEVIFKRLAGDLSQENGLRLEHRLELYEGSLKLSVQDGRILAVVDIPLENYLQGVVPYEMGDSFPLEALKAQAVAARTYAKANINPSSYYDVEDNTNDQVFRGKNTEHKNSVLAINDTEGECLYYGNSFAKCYYTASNGGKIETNSAVWGGKKEPYLIEKEDPYDFENPNSKVRSASIPKKWDTKTGDKLSRLLIQYALAEIEKAGYLAEEQYISIDEIKNLEIIENGENTYFKINVHFIAPKPVRLGSDDEEVSLFDNDNTPTTPMPTDMPVSYDSLRTESFALQIPYYKQIETALDISINGKNNEVISLKETDTAYIVQARRFGHGVGMSQRGAEQMAGKYNKTYRDILAFYYPDTTLKRTVLTSPPPQDTIPIEFLRTPGPPPTATPRPTLMPLTLKNDEQKAVVLNIGKNSTLNLRSAPSLSAKIQMQLFYGQELAVIERLPVGWLKVRTDAVEGYIVEEFVNLKQD
ncbi:MAG: SpoIID/LytB domain-containing protein [Eubacteriales bacterium]|nr:SpoIID/LytB domain-containing protein [Eubacteriales bacterium]